MTDRNKPLEPLRENEGQSLPDKEEITSSSIKNAHATGDGAIEKSDEVLLKPDEDEESSKRENY